MFLKKIRWRSPPVFLGILFSLPSFLYFIVSLPFNLHYLIGIDYPRNSFYNNLGYLLSYINRFLVGLFNRLHFIIVRIDFGLQSNDFYLQNIVFSLCCILLLFCIGYVSGYIIKLVHEKYEGSLCKFIVAFIKSSMAGSKWYKCPIFYGILFSIYDLIMAFVKVTTYPYIKDLDETQMLKLWQQFGYIFELYDILNQPIYYWLWDTYLFIIPQTADSVFFAILFCFLCAFLLFFIGIAFGHAIRKFSTFISARSTG
jgi:hypothetical protein